MTLIHRERRPALKPEGASWRFQRGQGSRRRTSEDVHVNLNEGTCARARALE